MRLDHLAGLVNEHSRNANERNGPGDRIKDSVQCHLSPKELSSKTPTEESSERIGIVHEYKWELGLVPFFIKDSSHHCSDNVATRNVSWTESLFWTTGKTSIPRTHIT